MHITKVFTKFPKLIKYRDGLFLKLPLVVFLFTVAIFIYKFSQDHTLNLLVGCYSKQNKPLERTLCVENWFESHSNPKDAGALLKVIHNLYSGNQISEQQCHTYEHIAAEMSFKDNGYNARPVLNACDNSPSCSGGCYHSAMMEAAMQTGLSDPALKQLIQLCDDRSDRSKTAQCFHGMGHGFVHDSGFDLLKSLNLCDQVTSDSFYRSSCYDGVFMQATEPDFVTGEVPPYFSLSDPLYPCSGVPEQYRPSCYRYAAERALGTRSFAETAAICLSITKEEWQQPCRIEVYTALVRSANESQEKQKICLGFGQKATECLAVVVIQMQNDPALKNQVKEFCRGLSGEQAQACQIRPQLSR